MNLTEFYAQNREFFKGIETIIACYLAVGLLTALANPPPGSRWHRVIEYCRALGLDITKILEILAGAAQKKIDKELQK